MLQYHMYRMTYDQSMMKFAQFHNATLQHQINISRCNVENIINKIKSASNRLIEFSASSDYIHFEADNWR